eukprot:SAG31_NODE_10147_length_1178_cov_0.886006_2_plen_224_part_01
MTSRLLPTVTLHVHLHSHSTHRHRGFLVCSRRLTSTTTVFHTNILTSGRSIWIVHSGDHAYEFEESDGLPKGISQGARGDGYMDSYSALLAHAPWAPGFGNHEYLRGDKANRLLNITAGLVVGHSSSSKQSGPLPMTAQWYSVEIGLLHLVHLDFSPYFCNFTNCCGNKGNCGFTERWSCDFTGYRDAILAWARQDLQSVDRAITPWVIISTHFPLYDTMLGEI